MVKKYIINKKHNEGKVDTFLNSHWLYFSEGHQLINCTYKKTKQNTLPVWAVSLRSCLCDSQWMLWYQRFVCVTVSQCLSLSLLFSRTTTEDSVV